MFEDWMLCVAYDVTSLLPVDPDRALGLLAEAEAYIRGAAGASRQIVNDVLPPESNEAMAILVLVRWIVERISRPYFLSLEVTANERPCALDKRFPRLPRKILGLSGASRRRRATSGVKNISSPK